MKSVIKISRHINNITEEILCFDRRMGSFDHNKDIIWKGAKRYAY